jgi:hypothetical protein
MTDSKPQEPQDSASEKSTLGCFLNLYRALLGPGILLVASVALFANPAAVGSVWDFIFLGALLATLAAGFLAPVPPPPAVRQPGDVDPMGKSKYAAILCGVAAAIYVIAHFVAPKIFRG